MTDAELISAAKHGITAPWPAGAVQATVKSRKNSADARLVLRSGAKSMEFGVQLKRHLNAALAAHLAGPEKALGKPLVVVSEHLQPAVTEVLRRRGMNYADAAGNCHIECPWLRLHVEGKTLKRSREHEPVRAFRGEGLKVVFLLLLKPVLAQQTYRQLAALAGTSHGVVQYTLSDLESLEYLVRTGGRRRRLRISSANQDLDLLDRWARGYVEYLRPKHYVGAFRFKTTDQIRKWKSIDLDSPSNRWGGEPAAALATEYLKPGKLTLHTRSDRSAVIRQLRLTPDQKGPLEVFRTFWPASLEEALPEQFQRTAVPHIVSYGDLLASADPRNAEVAALLRKSWESGVEGG